MPNKPTKTSRKGRDQVQNVRVVDQFSGSDSARFERMVNQLKSSESQIRVMVSGSSTLAANTSAINITIDIGNLATYDDFISIAQQYNLYRVSGLRVDLYDASPNFLVPTLVGTYHADGPAAFDFGSVADLPDSRSVSASGHESVTWLPKGNLENNFQSTTSPYISFGGVAISCMSASAANTKYVYTIKAIIDFRGRK